MRPRIILSCFAPDQVTIGGGSHGSAKEVFAGTIRDFAVYRMPVGSAGWLLVGVLLGAAGGYLGLGSLYGRRVLGKDGAALGLRGCHPHAALWLELHGLVLDGVRLVAAGGGGGGQPRASHGGDETLLGRDSPSGSTHSKKGKEGKEGKEGKAGKAGKSGKEGSPRKQRKNDKKKDYKDVGKDAPPPPPAQEEAGAGGAGAKTREWQPTRSVLQQGARETGVKGQMGHVPGQGLEGFR
eukprot:SAG22_NODE_11_length_35583_cov_107.128790_13_plen_238_part_00